MATSRVAPGWGGVRFSGLEAIEMKGRRKSKEASRLRWGWHGSGENPRAREGSDGRYSDPAAPSRCFNHAPHVERDSAVADGQRVIHPFQSRRPTRGATNPDWILMPDGDVSIHAPHEGRDDALILGDLEDDVSIHEGRDVADRDGGLAEIASIHAPHEGGATK